VLFLLKTKAKNFGFLERNSIFFKTSKNLCTGPKHLT
jgi:hypothetical protein